MFLLIQSTDENVTRSLALLFWRHCRTTPILPRILADLFSSEVLRKTIILSNTSSKSKSIQLYNFYYSSYSWFCIFWLSILLSVLSMIVKEVFLISQVQHYHRLC